MDTDPSSMCLRSERMGHNYLKGFNSADLTRERSASDAPPNLVGKPSIASLNSNATDVIAIEGEGDVTTPLLSSRSYDETVVVHKLNGRPTLPLPLCIAHRLQLYFASKLATWADFACLLIELHRMQGERTSRKCWSCWVNQSSTRPASKR